MTIWRLIPPLEAEGNLQMAIDEWLLEEHRRLKTPPTLRFYTWQPIALSLGYHQKRFPEFWQDLTWRGTQLELVRRPSGGRGVLHQGDLTYAVVVSGIGGSRMAAYRKICEFLIEGWRSLDIELVYGDAGRGYIHNPNCFATATGADLVLPNGVKLIGSAQLRRDRSILQHGSILLEPDLDLFAKVFGEEAPGEVLESLQKLSPKINATGETLRTIVIEALVEAAGRCFDVEFAVEPLSEGEWEAIANFRRQR
jgi:lipoate-protein ligase A